MILNKKGTQMARRSDHTRIELEEMAIAAGQKIIIAEGFNKFSARKVAKEMGYTVGTLYNVFKDYDDIILHINAATLDDMRDYILDGIKRLESMKDHDQSTQIMKKLAELYISFANENYNRWNALFEFNLPQNVPLPVWYSEKIKELSLIIETPLLPLLKGDALEAERTAKMLWAGIHGICQLGLTGKLDMSGVEFVKNLADTLIEHFMRGLNS